MLMPFHGYRLRLPTLINLMNLDQYYNLYHYLDTDQFSNEFTDQEQKRLMTQAKYFEIRHHLLYKKNRRNLDRPLRVIKWTEVELVLYMMHKHPIAGHLKTNAMYYKISECYYWDQMY